MADENQIIVLLNTMLSISKTRARTHKPPTMGGSEIFQILEARRAKNWAVEFLHVDDDRKWTDDERVKNGQGHDCLRLRHLIFEENKSFTYVTGLIEFVDVSIKSFPVVHVETYEGREISGDRQERGASTAHIVVRIPHGLLYDDGKYRCAIEANHEVTRHDIETLFCRQLRRYARSIELTFSAEIQGKRKTRTIEYKYTPQVNLAADVGRSLKVATRESSLAHMVFIKRIAVGTLISERPPHRTVRAEFPHTAPTSGV